MGDQCTIAFCMYCQVLIYDRVNRATFRVYILLKDLGTENLSISPGLEPMILWLRVQCLVYLANSPSI